MTTEHKHTLGPWNTGQGGRMLNIGHMGLLIATVECRSQHPATEAEAHMNARLIAAAPDLLAALQACEIELIAALLSTDTSQPFDAGLDTALVRTQAAIAKATQG